MTIKALWQPVIWTIPSVELYGANGPVFDSPDDAKNWVHGFFTGAMAMPMKPEQREALKDWDIARWEWVDTSRELGDHGLARPYFKFYLPLQKFAVVTQLDYRPRG